MGLVIWVADTKKHADRAASLAIIDYDPENFEEAISNQASLIILF